MFSIRDGTIATGAHRASNPSGGRVTIARSLEFLEKFEECSGLWYNVDEVWPGFLICECSLGQVVESSAM